jgi:hypothetical protein
MMMVRRLLMTRVVRLEYDFDTRHGRLYMEPHCNCDMGACIELFEKIDPEVFFIVTIAGDRQDTIYRKHQNGWYALTPHMQKKAEAIGNA